VIPDLWNGKTGKKKARRKLPVQQDNVFAVQHTSMLLQKF
jgi:hypothetical protein